jgi:UDP-N-acetylglucosamine 1-carboxyvinyltransferase
VRGHGHGTSTLTNAASEPHVQEFCRFMAMIGVRIEGMGTSRSRCMAAMR